jgi:hypothetical protein
MGADEMLEDVGSFACLLASPSGENSRICGRTAHHEQSYDLAEQ